MTLWWWPAEQEGCKQFMTAFENCVPALGSRHQQKQDGTHAGGRAAATACESCGSLQPEGSKLNYDNALRGLALWLPQPTHSPTPPPAGSALHAPSQLTRQPLPMGKAPRQERGHPLPRRTAKQQQQQQQQQQALPLPRRPAMRLILCIKLVGLWTLRCVSCWAAKFRYLGSHFTSTTELDTALS